MAGCTGSSPGCFRGRGVGDDRGDPEEPRAPQGPPTLENALAFSLGHVGFLR